MIRNSIERAVKDALTSLGAGNVSFVVERPAMIDHGQYATNAALAAAKVLKKDPRAVAEALKEKLILPQGVEGVSIAGAGFINFHLSREAVLGEVEKAATDPDWGKNTLYTDKTVMVEYTQPNPFKPFHIGHLMSNTIGESIARLLEYSAARVVRVNYQGDVGLHIAKALWGLQKKGYDAEDVSKIAECYVFGNAEYEHNEHAREEIIAINKQVYEKDPAILPLYTRGREVTLAHFEDLYRVLGTKFDHYFFESEVWQTGQALVREGQQKGIFTESKKAIVFQGEKYGLHTRVFITSEGLPTYEAKDLGLATAKLAFTSFDLSITTTAIEQKEYFKVVFEALAQLRPELRGKFISVTHGLMQLTSGKMSSRKGNVITGESLLADLEAAAKKKMEGRDIADREGVGQQVAVGAIKYAVLKQGSGKNILFDPEKSLSFEGDSGPYLQYAYTRAFSLVRAAEKAGVVAGAEDRPEAPTTLEQILFYFPDALLRSVVELEPHYLTTYLTELASAFNAWYASERVIGGTHPSYGMLLATAAEKTLRSGLSVLGISAPQEM